MIIDLNIRRETVDVRLEPSDGQSLHEVQRTLRTARIPFTTVRTDGRWEISSEHIMQVGAALELFELNWTTQADSRLALVREDNRIRQELVGQPSTLSDTLDSATTLGIKPYEEQLEAARLMSAPTVRRFALFWKPGSGKTGAMITAAHDLLSKQVISGVLVVAERPMAMQTPWVEELERWLPRYNRSGVVGVASGTKRDRLRVYLSDPQWLIIHYSILARDRYAITSWADRNEMMERPVVIFDESDLIKNSGAQRSRAAMRIRQSCGRCWIASGTPAPNSPSDYEHQLSVLSGYPVDLGLTGDRMQDSIVVVHELEQGVHYLQLDNPRRMPEVLTPLRVTLSSPQRDEYNSLAEDLVYELENIDDETYAERITHVMARRLRLLRLCSDPGHDSLPSPVFDMPAKWLQVDNLLETITNDPGEKAVIWTRFRDTAISLFERYRDRYGAALMIGGGEGTPDDLLRPECRVLVATIQVGASSISLTSARNAIYESLDDISRNLTQSMARINRIGQTKDCRYWFLITQDTIEEDLFENTMAKMQLSEDVLTEIGRPGRAQLIEMLKRTLGMSSQSA